MTTHRDSSSPSGLVKFIFCFFLFSSPSTAFLAAAWNKTICSELAVLLPNKVFLPNSTSYSTSTQSYCFRNSRQSPKCVVAPSSTEDVVKAIKAITAQRSVKFSVKGGGHSPNAGASNTDNGVTIDLGGLNSIESSDGNWDVISVGAGAKALDAYRVLDSQNRTVVGGRVASIGFSGFLTGGGLGFFSPQHGWGSDTIVNMEVVLASGDIINANATSHADLFRALKGGQNNFGVVTRFDLQSYPQGPFWGGAVQYPQEADDAQLEAFTRFKDPKRYDPDTASVEQTFIYYGEFGSFFSSNTIYTSKPIVNASGLQLFTDIRPQQGTTMRISNTTDFATELELLQPVNQYAIYSTTTFTISPTILKKIHSLWKTTTSELQNITNLTSVLTYQSVAPPAPASNPNSLGFPTDSIPHKNAVLALVSIYWPLSTDTVKVNAAIKNLQACIETTAQAEGVLSPFKYINYATTGWQKDAIRGYGEQEVQRLRNTAKKYDPKRVFQIQVPGGFKMPS